VCHIEEPVAAVLVAAELDADGPIGIIELGFFGRREIPIEFGVGEATVWRALRGEAAAWPAELKGLPSDQHALRRRASPLQ
jgi:hypothetical protein